MRRRVFAATAVTACGWPAIARFPAGAAEFSYKLGDQFPPAYPLTAPLADAADRIARESNGRLEIKIFGSGQLGGNLELLGQLRLGALEILIGPYADFATVVPVAGIGTLPFIVSDHKQAIDLITGRLGDYVHASFAKLGLFQLVPGSWDVGMLETANSVRPIAVASDVRSLKLRTTNSPTEIALFKALGAQPTALAAAEIYPGMQTHLVDGATLPLAAMDSFKFYEVAKYFSYTNHSWLGLTLALNAAAWDRLPKNLQDVVGRNFEIARVSANEIVARGDAPADANLKAHGMQLNAIDVQSFRKAVRDAGLYTQWKTSYPPEAWSLLERSVGRLS